MAETAKRFISRATNFITRGNNVSVCDNSQPDEDEYFNADEGTNDPIPDLSDILTIPPVSHFEKMVWGGISHSLNYKTFTNHDKSEYIKDKSIHNKTRLSCQFLFMNSRHGSKTFYKFHASDSIVSSFDGNFVAKFTISPKIDITIGSFTEKKRLVLKNIYVVEVFKDELLKQRNDSYNKFQTQMKSNDCFINLLDRKEFLFQISKLVNGNSQFNNLRILTELLRNKHVPESVKCVTSDLLKLDEELSERQINFPNSVTSSEYNINIFRDMKNIFNNILNDHRNLLFSHLKTYGPKLFNTIVDDLNRVSYDKYLYISENDIRLFSDLLLLCTQQNESSFKEYLLQYLSSVWKDFIKKVKSVNQKNISSFKDIGPLTDPIYHSFFKSYLDIMHEVSTITNTSKMDILDRNNSSSLKIKNKINWPERSCTTHSLQQQLHKILDLLNHFTPGNYSINKPYKHTLQEKLNMRESNKVFVYFLSDILMSVFDYENKKQNEVNISNTPFLKLQSNLIENYTKLVAKATENQFETFRVAAHSIIKFAAQICPYIFVLNSANTEDIIILNKQTDYMSVLLSGSTDDMTVKYFTSLLDSYIIYWERRQSVLSNLCNKVNHHFHPDTKEIISEILLIVKTALEKEGSLQSLINFFQNLNEFLHHLNSIDFSWIIKINGDILESWYEITDRVKNSAKVKLAKDLIKKFNQVNQELPKHYIILIVKMLLGSVDTFLHQNKWHKDTCVSATSELIMAVGQSFIYLREHSQYEDFEQFLDDSTKPFENLILNYTTYDDFKKRIDNISNFYVYTRKQNEINFIKAIDLFCEAANVVESCGFKCKFDKNILEYSFNQYQKVFKDIFNDFSDVDSVLSQLKIELNSIDTSEKQIENWATDFKQNTVPKMLAYLSAIWSMNESKDVVCTNRRLQPHCIQILCILRLLGADYTEKGVKNHLAQVLTGQGKSIVLGLLAALLAVMGHKVQLVCYSQYLADRDQNDFDMFFKQLKIRPNINYGTFDDMAGQVLEPEVDGRTENLRTLVEKLLKNELPKRSSDKFSYTSSETILLIDEVDVFFSNDFYGNTYNPIKNIHMKMLAQIQIKIWDSVQGGNCDVKSIKQSIHDFIRITAITPDSEHKDKVFDKFLSNSQSFFEKNLDLMIEEAIEVKKGNDENWYINNFRISDDGLITYKVSSGLFKTSTFCSYYNAFNYFRLKRSEFETKDHNYGYLRANCGNISYAMLPKEFRLILGVSGTLTDLSNSEKQAIKSYNIIEVSSMPTFFGRCNLSFNSSNNFTLSPSIDSWLNQIYDNAYKKIHSGVAVIVFFESEANINLFRREKERNFSGLQVLTGNEINKGKQNEVGKQKSLDWLISVAGIAKTITLATRLMGRGVDFKSNDSSVEEKGGVHIIQTFYSPDVKEEIQIKGRTARKDNKGSYELIICKEHLNTIEGFKGADINSYSDMCSIRRAQADLETSNNLERVRKSEEKHTKTMEFLKSLLTFDPNQRSSFLSSYPLNE